MKKQGQALVLLEDKKLDTVDIEEKKVDLFSNHSPLKMIFTHFNQIIFLSLLTVFVHFIALYFISEATPPVQEVIYDVTQ